MKMADRDDLRSSKWWFSIAILDIFRLAQGICFVSRFSSVLGIADPHQMDQ